ncbi:serine hydrolase domain-containing protein [Saccharibacillus qingshengii]|uniref:serine hydrolase domain-containing protein n=1 Tax=Saccharibacillus qingshengii TaxID=1763540 RepID=UPI0015524D19|nr:serine hydrolase domain-containing protein [Saccharibacillus qingshengii]
MFSRLKSGCSIRRLVSALPLLLLLPFLLPYSSSAEEVSLPAAETTPSGIRLDELEAYIDHFVEPYINKTTAAASIAVVKNGQIVLSKGYGLADIEQKVPAEPDTVFEWGSISKLFVWTSAMQLAEEGKLDLEADIRRYLPDGFLKRLTYPEAITFMDLMNHTAGFEEYMFDMAYTSPDQVRTLEQGLRLAEPNQIYRPGENVAYSNYGNSLAAYIVERISGQPYNEYVNEHILKRLDMNQTEITSVLDSRLDLQARKAIGYLPGDPGNFVKGSWNYMSMYPNGGANGTAEDLARFAAAFMPENGQATPLFGQPETLSTFLSPSRSSDRYMPGIAHGLWEYPGASRTLGHGGNTMAFSSTLQFVPDQHFAVVILTNQSGEANLVHGLAQALLGSPEIPASDSILPDSSRISGSFIAARRAEQGFMGVYPYLSMLHLSSEALNRLSVKLAGFEGEYRQIRPYLYERISGDAELGAWPFLHIDMENDRIQRISVYTTDYLPLSGLYSVPLLTAQAAAAGIALLFFLIVPPGSLLAARFSRRSRTGTPGLRRKTLALQWSGLLLAVNNLVLAFRMLSQNERPYSDVQPQLILNSVLTAAGLIALLLIVFELKRRPALPLRSKINLLLSISLWLILALLLIVWQFYR